MKAKRFILTVSPVILVFCICSCFPDTAAFQTQVASKPAPTDLESKNTDTVIPDSPLTPEKIGTAIPTSTNTSATPTEAFSGTETIQVVNYSSILFLYHPRFGYLSLDINNGESDLHTLSEPNSSPPTGMPTPGGAVYLSFANNTERMVYWQASSPGELWLSDLTLGQNSLLLTDTEGNDQLAFDFFPYSELNIYWTPSDQYIILDFRSDQREDLIIDTETLQSRPWAYSCNQIGLSPETSSWALWCSSQESNQDHYAVFERDDKLWFSDKPPENILVDKGDMVQNLWKWSPNKQKIAFFDPNESSGSLRIADGQQTVSILNNVYFGQAEALQYTQMDPIQWSGNGNQILFYGRDPINNLCPKWKDSFGSGLTYTDIPCWQVFNLDSAEVEWILTESVAQIENTTSEIFNTFVYNAASLSGDGSLVAVSYSSGGVRNLFVADVQTGQVISTGWPVSAISMLWDN